MAAPLRHVLWQPESWRPSGVNSSQADVNRAQLRNFVRRLAEDLDSIGFDYGHGFGLIDAGGIIESLEQTDVRLLHVGETASSRLRQTGDTAMFKISVGHALNIELDGPQGLDFDLYVKKDSAPTVTDYDHRGFAGSAMNRSG